MTRVLIIDDEPSLTRLLQLSIERHGKYSVRTAATAKEGVSVARTYKPHVVLLDVVMPDLSGMEACRHIEEDATEPVPTIIFLTALFPRPGADTGTRQIAGYSFFPKPVDIDALLKRLDRVSGTN